MPCSLHPTLHRSSNLTQANQKYFLHPVLDVFLKKTRMKTFLCESCLLLLNSLDSPSLGPQYMSYKCSLCKRECYTKLVVGVNRPAIVRGIPHFCLFPAFLPERPAFLALFRITKIAENHNNFKLYGDILFEKSLRKRQCYRHIPIKVTFD